MLFTSFLKLCTCMAVLVPSETRSLGSVQASGSASSQRRANPGIAAKQPSPIIQNIPLSLPEERYVKNIPNADASKHYIHEAGSGSAPQPKTDSR